MSVALTDSLPTWKVQGFGKTKEGKASATKTSKSYSPNGTKNVDCYWTMTRPVRYLTKRSNYNSKQQSSTPPNSSSNNRHSLFRWDCSFCSFSLPLPSPLWSFQNLEPSKLEGGRLALRTCVEVRCQDVECLSTLSVLCLVIALSDCI